jgi:replicative DNA helicase
MQRDVVLPTRRDSRSRSQPALLPSVAVSLPHNIGSERTILSGLLKEWKWVSEVMSKRKLTAASFYEWHHSLVFVRLNECAKPGPYTLFTRLRETKEISEWENLAAWLADLWNVDPTGCDAEYAADVMREAEVRRTVITRANELIRDARKRVMGPEEYADLLARLK